MHATHLSQLGIRALSLEISGQEAMMLDFVCHIQIAWDQYTISTPALNDSPDR